MADGCIIHSKRIRYLKTMDSLQERFYLQISLSSVDRHHLEKFLQSINATHPIKDYIVSCGYKIGSLYSRVTIEDRKMCDDLILQGVFPKKQLHEKYPSNLKDEFDLAFIRGYFDGDGCISSHKNKRGNKAYEFSFTGTKEILTSIAEKMNLPITDKRLKQRHPERNLNNYTMKFGGNEQTLYFMNMLYENAKIYLDRKHEKFLELYEFKNGRFK